jgi:hypothetical protein
MLSTAGLQILTKDSQEKKMKVGTWSYANPDRKKSTTLANTTGTSSGTSMAFQRFTEWTAKANHLLTVFPKW